MTSELPIIDMSADETILAGRVGDATYGTGGG